MTNKACKTWFILNFVWLILLLTIVSCFKFSTIESSLEAFEHNLKKFEKRETKGGETSRSKNWRLLSQSEFGISLEDRYQAVLGHDFPPGMNGEPVFLRSDIKNPLRAIVQQGWREHAFNSFVSDIIPINRTLPDYRDDWCKCQNYSGNLPQASVVITFHNEALSTLQRTIYSVLKRSPKRLLKEIILYDDGSDKKYLQDPLNKYIECMPKVKLVRSFRQGLIRARLRATEHVTAPVVIFLDSHVECTKGWLEPLLDRIAKDATRVVSPIVDSIHKRTFEYIPQEVSDLRIGGFTWDLKFTWLSIPQKTLKKRNNLSAPIETPTISGGLFAINRKFFERLGYYDEQFEYWGAENLELSFKTWMCNGSLEIVPCSRVGHVFRKIYPYTKRPELLRRNFIRLAEVWMDDYKKYFYETIGSRDHNFGDVTKRKLLREQLKCKSFEWYLTEVYPQLEKPEVYVALGMIYGLSGDMLCFDSSPSIESFSENVKLVPCHYMGGNQFWTYTKDGELKRENMCLDDLGDNLTVKMNLCNGQTSQSWIFNKKSNQIQNMKSKLCIGSTMTPYEEGGWVIRMQHCNKGHRQTWAMNNYNEEKLSPQLQAYANKSDSFVTE